MTEGGSCHCVALCATHAASAALARKAGRHVALLPGLPRGGAGQRMAPSFSGQRRHVARGAPLPLYSRASSAKPDRDFAGSRLRTGPRPECTARTAASARPGPRRRSSGSARTRRAGPLGRRSQCPSADAARPGYVIHVSARSSVGPRRRAGVNLARRPAGGRRDGRRRRRLCQASWGRTQLAADGCGDIIMAGVRVCYASRIGRSRLGLGLGPAS